jgi:hypothetical protein
MERHKVRQNGTFHNLNNYNIYPLFGSSRPRELPPQALTDPYVRLSPHTALLIHRPSSIQNPNAQTTLAGFPDSA